MDSYIVWLLFARKLLAWKYLDAKNTFGRSPQSQRTVNKGSKNEVQHKTNMVVVQIDDIHGETNVSDVYSPKNLVYHPIWD